ncbi:MAG TPA: hypothetical protein VHD76_16840 [Bryobacteraceae bacterium]|nr:hypothetical protein [Bryobacteraceae bacterium]
MIVFAVADAHDLLRGEPQFLQGDLESGHFVDAGGQHHGGIAVADDLKAETEFTNQVAKNILMLPGGRDYHLSHRDRIHAPSFQRFQKISSRRRR